MAIPLGKAGKRLTLILFLLALPPWVVTGTAQAADFDKPVFEFQSKMANQGNAHAQYLLAQMYEEGRGTKADPELAKHWYEQARNNGFDPAAPVPPVY